MLISFPYLSTSLLTISPIPKVICKKTLPKHQDFCYQYKMISWQKSFVGHKHPKELTEFVCISFLYSYRNFLFTGAADKLIKIWNADTGALLYSFHGHSGRIIGIAVIGDLVVSACQYKVIIWELLSGNINLDINDFESEIIKLISYSTDKFIVCCKSGLINSYTLDDKKLESKTWECEKITTASISPNNQYIATATTSSVKIWEINECSLVCVYIINSDITQIKWNLLEDFLACIGDELKVFNVSCDRMFKYWERNCRPLKRPDFQYKGTGCIEWCNKKLLAGLDIDGCFVLLKYFDRKTQVRQYDYRILDIAALPSAELIATGDEAGYMIIWDTNSLEKLYSHKETGDLCLFHGVSISITHIIFNRLYLITGTKKGTHTFYGFGGREQLICSPIQQFYSLDYLSNYTKNLTLCDFKLMPYKFQPEISNYYKQKGYKSPAINNKQLHEYFKSQEASINLYDLEYQNIELLTDSEESNSSMSCTSVQSLLEINVDNTCTRCKKPMLENNVWCNCCGKVFHSACFEVWKFFVEEEVCLVCYKAQRVYKDLKASQRCSISALPASPNALQVGDSVVFLFQGYEKYLKDFMYIPLLDPEILQYTTPTVMNIVNIEYMWPLHGPIDPVAPNVCMKVHLKVLGHNSTYCIYYSLLGDRFLILVDEYYEKLWNLQENNQQIFEGKEINTLNITPYDSSFETSPWKSIVLSHTKLSFWDYGEYIPQSVTVTTRCCLSKFTMKAAFIYYPNAKNYKNMIPMPMCLQLIEQRLSSNYYRSVNSVISDIDLILSNTKQYFGEDSAEAKDFKKIVEKIKTQVIKTIKKIVVCNYGDIKDEFKSYVPWNQNQMISSVKSTENRKKLRKLN